MFKCRQVSVALVLALLTLPLAQGAGEAQAQSATDVSKRIEKLEAEMRAVQRQVFPGGASKYFQPEFSDQATGEAAQPQGEATGDLLTDMQARITQLEQQLASLTGQIEEANFRARRAEESLTRLREDVEYRLTVLEGGDPAAAANTAKAAGAAGAAGAAAGAGAAGAAKTGEAQPFPPPGFDPASPGVSGNATDPAVAAGAATVAGLSPDEQYKAAYAFVNQNDYPRAEAALSTFIQKNPGHARVPDAKYWLARVHLVQKKYALAAKGFLDTYQQHPKATRAPDSLLGLGDALIGLGNLQEACQAFNQLEIDYPSKITGTLKTRLEQGRAKAKCK